MLTPEILQGLINHLKDEVKEIQGIATQAQEDWSGVDETYAPEWTHPYKQIIKATEQILSRWEKEAEAR